MQKELEDWPAPAVSLARTYNKILTSEVNKDLFIFKYNPSFWCSVSKLHDGGRGRAGLSARPLQQGVRPVGAPTVAALVEHDLPGVHAAVPHQP